MDQLAVTIAPQEEADYGEPTLGLYASAVVNAQALPDVLDIDVFFEVLRGDGLLPLFTCTCGVFGCGGYYVGIARDDRTWIWRNRYAPNDEPNPGHIMEAGEFRFAWSDVRAVAMDILATLYALRRDKPGVRLMSASTGTDLRDRLEHYQEQVQTILDA